MEFYNRGRGHAVPQDEDLRIHWHISEPNLSEYELDRLVDFLKTLTDETFKPRVPEKLASEAESVHKSNVRKMGK